MNFSAPSETIGKKTYEVSAEVRQVAEKIIGKFNPNGLKDSPAQIEYLIIYPNINKTTVARCIKARPEFKFLTGFHYVIEVSGEIWDKLGDDIKEILTYHELLHANPVMNEKRGEWDYRLRDHDVKDFYTIIKQNGIDWFTSLKTQVSSIYDLKPEEEDNISL
jgi:hypothetical protein